MLKSSSVSTSAGGGDSCVLTWTLAESGVLVLALEVVGELVGVAEVAVGLKLFSVVG